MVIEGASVSVKTMADGTLRLLIDIEPRNAQDAFALFGAPGRAVALAALKDGAGAVKETETGNPATEKPKGGEWAKLAGMWCADPEFWSYLWRERKVTVENEAEAAQYVRGICQIDSRAELDHSKQAWEHFNQQIRYPFMKWMQARGIQK